MDTFQQHVAKKTTGTFMKKKLQLTVKIWQNLATGMKKNTTSNCRDKVMFGQQLENSN